MTDDICGAPHPAYGDGDVCRKAPGHEEPHKGGPTTETWTDAAVLKFQPDHRWTQTHLIDTER